MRKICHGQRKMNPSTLILLRELGEKCQDIFKLLAQLEVAGLGEAQQETILGELNAAVLHLHEGHDHPFGQKNLDYASQAPLHPGYTGFDPNDDHGPGCLY